MRRLNKQASRVGEKFTNGGATATTIRHKADLLNRVSALRTKAQALTKRATAYEKAAGSIRDDDGEPLFEDNAAGMGLVYIGDVLPLSRKELVKSSVLPTILRDSSLTSAKSS